MVRDCPAEPCDSFFLLQLSPPPLASGLLSQAFSPRVGLPRPQESCGSSSRSLSKRPALGLLPSSGPSSAPCGPSERLAPSPGATPHFSVFPFFFSLSRS